MARGIYCYRTAPRTTARRIRLFGTRCHTYVTGLLARANASGAGAGGAETGGWDEPPPWANLNWLWAT